MIKEKQREKELVIPVTAVPPKASQEIDVDGEKILLHNEAMFTSYQHSCGEFSKFFLAIRDKKKILGHQCPECRQIICPPFMKRCPTCGFVEMLEVEVPDTGEMVASPTITFFGNARFKTRVPFALGYVYLGESHTAILLLAYTTKGILQTGIFKKGTPVKVVFKDKRIGSTSDLFVVPQNELPQKLITKNGLLESEINWEKPVEPRIHVTPAHKKKLDEAMKQIYSMARLIPKSERATAALAGWHTRINFKTGGGDFGIEITNSTLKKIDTSPVADLQLVVQDPSYLIDWVRGRALTNMIADGNAWIDKSEGLNIIFLLDRLPRALRRDVTV
ncbi:MAG: hypothetical protein JRG73_17380 [Deltaproteobacteria bacterium]|nr:hypothetical protein [Deltaproteobacteria bacterium]MBW2308699.1 hypothetical protein [Deltaproteobacteria bacterium]